MFWLVLIIALLVGLQILLSCIRPWWPGLILPIAVLLIFFLVILETVVVHGGHGALSVLGLLFGPFVSMFLLGIYFLCRYLTHGKSKADRMKIQDLN